MTKFHCPNLERPLSAERRKTIGAPPEPPRPPLYKIAVTRPVRISRHTTVLRTKIVWVADPAPRIPGAIITNITNKETQQ